MKTLNFDEMEMVQGGIDRFEYCNTLYGFMTGDGYQGDWEWLFYIYSQNCISW